MEAVIQIHQVSKTFRGTETISNVNMNVNKGEIYGFLGPNGAGKTTIMKMMLNLVKPSSGEIKVFNQPVLPTSYQYLKRIGSIIEYPVFYDRLTAKKIWNFIVNTSVIVIRLRLRKRWRSWVFTEWRIKKE